MLAIDKKIAFKWPVRRKDGKKNIIKSQSFRLPALPAKNALR
jgi:hypothetical protein